MEEQNIIVEKRNHLNIKTIIAIITLILVMAVALIVIFSSPIPKDYKKLRQNLRDEDYYVISSTDRDEILEGLEEVFDEIFYYDDEGLEDELYKLIEKSMFSEHEFSEMSKDIESLVVGVDEDYENFIIAVYFDDKASAKEFFDFVCPLLEFVAENGSDGEIFENIKRSDFTFDRKGKVIYIGTKDALKASK